MWSWSVAGTLVQNRIINKARYVDEETGMTNSIKYLDEIQCSNDDVQKGVCLARREIIA